MKVYPLLMINLVLLGLVIHSCKPKQHILICDGNKELRNFDSLNELISFTNKEKEERIEIDLYVVNNSILKKDSIENILSNKQYKIISANLIVSSQGIHMHCDENHKILILEICNQQ